MKLSDFLSREGITPSALAEKIGVPSSTITRILRGARKPGLDLMVAISKATNGEVSALADFEVEEDSR